MNTASIFINYSRRDAAGDAGRLQDSLRDLFEDRYFFLDVNQLQEGDNFPPLIKKSIEECTIFIAVIGPRWLQMFRKTEERGEVNWVRTEIALALKKKKFILPVLVSEARMPLPNQLPDDIKALTNFNAAELNHKRWTYDIGRIANTINRQGIPLIKATKQGERKSFYLWIGVIAVLLTAIIFISKNFTSKPKPVVPSRVTVGNIPSYINGTWRPVADKAAAMHYTIAYANDRVVVEQFNSGVLVNTGTGTLKGRQLSLTFPGRFKRTFELVLSDDQQTLTGSQILGSTSTNGKAGVAVTWRKLIGSVR